MLKKLLDEKKYKDVEEFLSKHFTSKDKNDVASSQKVTNLVAFQLHNEKNVDGKVMSFLLKFFNLALDCVISNKEVSQEIKKKVADSCCYVILRLCKDEDQNSALKNLLILLPKLEKFGKIENSKVHDLIYDGLLNFAKINSSVKLALATIKCYRVCVSDKKQENLDSGLLRIVKNVCFVIPKNEKVGDVLDQIHVDGLPKIPILLLKLENKIGDFNGLSQEVFQILIDELNIKNEKSLLSLISRFLTVLEESELIDLAINTAKLVSKQKNKPYLFPLYFKKFKIEYEKNENWSEAMEAAENLVSYSSNESQLEYGMNCYAKAKVKAQSNKLIKTE